MRSWILQNLTTKDIILLVASLSLGLILTFFAAKKHPKEDQSTHEVWKNQDKVGY